MPRRLKPVPTIADVARECGVGSMTVSRVMNGKKHVSVAMTKRVRAAIIKLGYEPNEAARILKGQPPRTIGLIVPDLADPFFSTCAHAIQQLAAKQGYMTLLFACEGQKNTEAEELALMKSRNIAGILIVPSNISSDHELKELRRRGVPIVMLDRTLPDLDAGEVMVENREGTRKAIDHLIEHGHRQILCLGYDSKFNSIGHGASRIQAATSHGQPGVFHCAATSQATSFRDTTNSSVHFKQRNDHHYPACAPARKYYGAARSGYDRVR
jgi:LacI family transcriptional regulator